MAPNPVPPSERIALSPQEASNALGLSKPTLQRLIDSGELPSFLIGRRRLIIRSDLEELARKRREKYTSAARGES